jgi:hypothetical protein
MKEKPRVTSWLFYYEFDYYYFHSIIIKTIIVRVQYGNN